jgi:hypothetical protein
MLENLDLYITNDYIRSLKYYEYHFKVVHSRFFVYELEWKPLDSIQLVIFYRISQMEANFNLMDFILVELDLVDFVSDQAHTDIS